MPIITETIPLQFIENTPTSERQAELFRIWRQNNGVDHPDMVELADHLVMFGIPVDSPIPQITFQGDLSLASIVMGPGWRIDVKKRNEENVLASAYEAVKSGDPVHEWVQFKGPLRGSNACLEYERLVLLFRTPKGFPYIVTLSTLLRFDRDEQAFSSANLRTTPGYNPTTNSLVLLGRDTPASVAHLQPDP